MILAALAWMWLSAAPAFAAPEPALEFRVAGKARQRLTLGELKAKLTSENVRFFSPFSDREKNYEAFLVRDVLNLAYGEDWKKADYSDVAFIALDGYEAVGGLSKLGEDGGWLAFRDLDVPGSGCPKGLSGCSASGWELVGHKKADPGPFFLVWSGKHQTTEQAYPWPWQIAAINLIRFEDQYPAVVPTGAAEESAPWRGFAIFKARCIRCHAMNLEGGKIGPDLNSPQSITAYRSKGMILAFIRQTSKYRHSQMPDHTDLSDRDLDDLYRYFKHQAKRSGKTW